MSVGPQAVRGRSPLQQLIASSSWAGLYVGAYWAVKYLAVLFLFQAPALMSFLYIALTVPVPFIVYRIVRAYRNAVVGRPIQNQREARVRQWMKMESQASSRPFTFAEGYLYHVLVYIFAAVTVAILHFVFYAYVLPAHYDVIEEVLRQPQLNPFWEQAQITVDELMLALDNYSPAARAFDDVANNMVWGGIIGIPVAAILRTKLFFRKQNPSDNDGVDEDTSL